MSEQKLWFCGWSLVTSLEPGRDLCSSISPAKPPLQSSQGDSCATHMDKRQFQGLFSAILHGLTHNCRVVKQEGSDHGESVFHVPSNVSMGDGGRDSSQIPTFTFHGGSVRQRPGWWRNLLEQKVYKGKGLILCHSSSDPDTDLFICSVVSSFPHTDFVPWWLGRRQLETSPFPGNLWKKTPQLQKKQQPK